MDQSTQQIITIIAGVIGTNVVSSVLTYRLTLRKQASEEKQSTHQQDSEDEKALREEYRALREEHRELREEHRKDKAELRQEIGSLREELRKETAENKDLRGRVESLEGERDGANDLLQECRLDRDQARRERNEAKAETEQWREIAEFRDMVIGAMETLDALAAGAKEEIEGSAAYAQGILREHRERQQAAHKKASGKQL